MAKVEIFFDWIKKDEYDSPYLFHRKGKLFRYNSLLESYNRAWKKAGLEKFSGSHLMRYASSQKIRKLTGSIDSVMALTGHISTSIASKYSDYGRSSQNKELLIKMGNLISS